MKRDMAMHSHPGKRPPTIGEAVSVYPMRSTDGGRKKKRSCWRESARHDHPHDPFQLARYRNLEPFGFALEVGPSRIGIGHGDTSLTGFTVDGPVVPGPATFSPE